MDLLLLQLGKLSPVTLAPLSGPCFAIVVSKVTIKSITHAHIAGTLTGLKALLGSRAREPWCLTSSNEAAARSDCRTGNPFLYAQRVALAFCLLSLALLCHEGSQLAGMAASRVGPLHEAAEGGCDGPIRRAA